MSVQKISLPIQGMHCASCAATIQKVVRKVSGIKSVNVNYGTEKAEIEFEEGAVNIHDLSKRIEPFGYHFIVSPTQTSHQHVGQISSNQHTDHAGINVAKEEKIKEVRELRDKVYFVAPLTLLVFVLMMWEVLSISYSDFPRFFLPMEWYQPILLALATIVLFWIGRPFLRGVMTFVRHRVANMDSLIGIGTLTAYVYSTMIVLFPVAQISLKLPETTYFDVTIVVIGFITLGKYLEARSKIRTGEALEKLMNLQAKTALVERDGREVELPIDQIRVGDKVVVKPGAKVPIDGEIIEGSTWIDESMVTGESLPVEKRLGDIVIGSTINKQGSLRIRVTKVGSETMLAHIIRMVEEAQGSRAPIQKLADTVSAIFVPIVLIIAIVTMITWILVTGEISFALITFVSILVIACPCALGLATPTAIIVGVGKGASNGILIKNAESLEKLHNITTLVVDKTGTITKGKPEVTDITVLSSMKEDDILGIAAALEKKSEHPLAEAVVSAAARRSILLPQVTNFSSSEGKGVYGTINAVEYFVGSTAYARSKGAAIDPSIVDNLTRAGKTPIVVGSHKTVYAIFGIADTVKDSAKDTIARLHRQHIRVVMLTGDHEQTAKAIAQQVAIDEVIAQVLPHEKAEKIRELQKRGERVAMAGDGVNDAPALAQSDVGIAMATGTDVAIESADITLLHGDISKIPQAIALSKKTIRTVRQNLFWAFIYNVIGIPLAAGVFYPFFGWLLNPVFAGLAMAFSSVSVVMNSLRLKAGKL